MYVFMRTTVQRECAGKTLKCWVLFICIYSVLDCYVLKYYYSETNRLLPTRIRSAINIKQ